MKPQLKTILIYFLLSFFLFSCTKQEIIDTGTSNPKFNGTIMQYLRQDTYNWGLTVEMIERGGLTELFEGKVDSLKEITFFGPTSYSILRHLYDNKMDSVDQLSPQFCKESILKHIVKGPFLREKIPFRNKQFYIYDPQQPSVSYLSMSTLGGNKLRAYLEKKPYGGVPDVGPIEMFLFSMTANTQVPLASPDIQPSNGVVHSLNYNYKLNNL